MSWNSIPETVLRLALVEVEDLDSGETYIGTSDYHGYLFIDDEDNCIRYGNHQNGGITGNDKEYTDYVFENVKLLNVIEHLNLQAESIGIEDDEQFKKIRDELSEFLEKKILEHKIKIDKEIDRIFKKFKKEMKYRKKPNNTLIVQVVDKG